MSHRLSLRFAHASRRVRGNATHLIAVAAAIQLAACGEAPIASAPKMFEPGAPARSLTLGSITNIGSLGSGGTIATAISNTSMVAGASVTTQGGYHAFIWTQSGGMKDLGTLPNGTSSIAWGVNSSGQVVGDSYDGAGKSHAFLWTAASGMKDLGTLPGASESLARGINEAGQVVGYSSGTIGLHAFVWSASAGMVDLDPQGGFRTAEAINNKGMIVGYGIAPNTSGINAYVWTPERGIHWLPNLGGDNSEAFAISDAGLIGGSSNLASGASVFHAVMWTSGVARDLGTFGGTWANVRAIGPNGEAFGDYTLPNDDLTSRGFRWTPTFGMEDLTNATGIGIPWAVNRELRVVGSQYVIKIPRVGY